MNVLLSGTELQFRSGFIDRILEDMLTKEGWLKYLYGEVENTQITKARATAREQEFAKGPLHDGIGQLIFSRFSLPILFVEVAGGPSCNNLAKYRRDVKKVVKTMVVCLSVQRALLQESDMGTNDKPKGLERLVSYGIVVNETTFHFLTGRFIKGKVCVEEGKKVKAPGRSEDWSLMGDLYQELYSLQVM
jgi:hypothetical protein